MYICLCSSVACALQALHQEASTPAVFEQPAAAANPPILLRLLYTVTPPCIPCRFYITPRSFLDLLCLYGRLMQQQQVISGADRERLVNGLTKLRQTNETVDIMQRELTALQPVLQQKTAATEQLLVQVETFWPQGPGAC